MADDPADLMIFDEADKLVLFGGDALDHLIGGGGDMILVVDERPTIELLEAKMDAIDRPEFDERRERREQLRQWRRESMRRR